MLIDEVVNRIAQVTGYPPKRSGNGWKGKCPAHEDNNPSLSIVTSPEGNVIVKCWTGCSTHDICEAIGLKQRDLFINNKKGYRQMKKSKKQKKAWRSLHDAIRGTTPSSCIDQVQWLYPGENFAVARFNLASDKKNYFPYHKTSEGWVCGDPEGKLPLYLKPPLPPDSPVIVVEGEKCAAAMTNIGLPAVTSAHGAKSPHKSDWNLLAGRNVAIFPDNDKAGHDYANKVACILSALQPPAQVCIVTLPDLPEGGDIVDWMEPGGHMHGKPPDEIREAILKLIDEAPPWLPPAQEMKSESEEFEEYLTDMGNSACFVNEHKQDIRFCKPIGRWYLWSGKCWKPDEKGQIYKLAKKTIRNFLQKAKNEPDPEKAGSLLKHAMKSQSKARIEAMIDLAGYEVPIEPIEFDRDPMLLNVINGTIDLKTGELREHCREDYLTIVAPVRFDPQADYSIWQKFITEITAGDKELASYLQRLTGYALTADSIEQALFIMMGNGGNGKSVFLDTVMAMLGGYAGLAPPNLLQIRKGFSEHPTEIADLMGKRLIVASESDEGGRLNIQFVKRLTGDAMLKGRFMRQDYIEFPCKFKLILCTNNRPKISERSDAIWRRIRLVPFNVTFRPEQQDKRLVEKLKKEWPGILRWAIEGCLSWQKIGLSEPEAVLRATKLYRQEEDEDDISEFIADRCSVQADNFATHDELYLAFSDWYRETYLPLISKRAFLKRVRQLVNVRDEQRRFNTERKKGFVGIALKTDDEGDVTHVTQRVA